MTYAHDDDDAFVFLVELVDSPKLLVILRFDIFQQRRALQ